MISEEISCDVVGLIALDTHRRRGEDEAAIDCEVQQLAVCRELGDRFGEASALTVLAELYDRSGNARAAADAAQQAQEILAELDPAAAESICPTHPTCRGGDLAGTPGQGVASVCCPASIRR
ncbi:hypothetical protein ACQEVB_24060 [Pseudonocardia sp. CA-107938]|uniref:hypothetical protein n=1 Tax=Pseudonocardia sp. CA-107938 TaxID=3240021 RepID=UPI003D8B7AE3